MLIWTIISFIVLVHVFKIRYLNYYDELINEEKVDTKNDKKKEEKSKIKEDKKDRIIIRDENTRPFAFLSVLSKIIIIFVKVFVFFFGLFFMFTLLMLAIFFIISALLLVFKCYIYWKHNCDSCITCNKCNNTNVNNRIYI